MTTTTPTTTTTYITLYSRKRASGNTCDAVYFLDRTLQGVQSLKLSNMQFYNTIYNINQYNNLIGFISTSSNGTELMYIRSLDFVGMPAQVHIYISKVVNSYIGVLEV